ncbi:MAG: SpoIID/LytB domain-containing protein [Pilosibacter sp.]
MEITEERDGLLLLNEVDLEEYLKRVTPSEMPPTYELEALKAQAICARTYAWRQIQGNAYSATAPVWMTARISRYTTIH